ncbi:MAG: FMN-dependent NADH-azoreductase [Sulfurifustis sp.]
MTTVLQLNTSIHSANGHSSRIADQFVAGWRARHPETTLIKRDFAAAPVPHLTAERFSAFTSKPADRSPAQQAVVSYSDALIEELKRADVVVLALPMYNFGVPSTLKAYFDHIARAGATFRYTEKGPVGLLGGKKVYVIATRGGLYAGTPLDSETGYVRDLLNFLGMSDVEFIYAEGLAISEAAKQAGLAHARNAIERTLAPASAAA